MQKIFSNNLQVTEIARLQKAGKRVKLKGAIATNRNGTNQESENDHEKIHPYRPLAKAAARYAGRAADGGIVPEYGGLRQEGR